jgi:hypothetical protein
MATYSELRALFGHDDLRHRAEVAVIVAAETIRNEDGGTPNHANRMVWAKAVFGNPVSAAAEMLMALLAANKDSAVAAITDVSDSALQTLVDAAVDVFATG